MTKTKTYTDEEKRWQALPVSGSVPEAVKSVRQSMGASSDKQTSAWEDYVNRQAFSYDPEEDPLYGDYAKLYADMGKLAMEDTVGKAAALTGGYDNSYAQLVGQQAYDSYMRQLSAMMPEFYDRAYERYKAEGEAMYDQILLQQKQEAQALEEMEESYKKLTDLMAMGYTPTDTELAQAGLTREQADAVSSYYARQATTQVKTATASQTKEAEEAKAETDIYGSNVELTYENLRRYLRANELDVNIVMPKNAWIREKRMAPRDPQFAFSSYEEYLESIMDYIREVRKKK